MRHCLELVVRFRSVHQCDISVLHWKEDASDDMTPGFQPQVTRRPQLNSIDEDVQG
jgi:hypothetical protein